jgi:hypothetical protein
MRYSVALSFCGMDAALAESLYFLFRSIGIGCHCYKMDNAIGGLILARHLEVYRQAHSRVYLLRRQSFASRYVRLEISCGNGLTNNVVVPVEAGLAVHIPNQFLFMTEMFWHWLPYREVIDQVSVVRAIEMLLT